MWSPSLNGSRALNPNLRKNNVPFSRVFDWNGRVRIYPDVFSLNEWFPSSSEVYLNLVVWWSVAILCFITFKESANSVLSVFTVSLSCLCVYFTIELSMNLLYIQSLFVSIIVSVVFAVLLQGVLYGHLMPWSIHSLDKFRLRSTLLVIQFYALHGNFSWTWGRNQE
jgi:hypothetical protein